MSVEKQKKTISTRIDIDVVAEIDAVMEHIEEDTYSAFAKKAIELYLEEIKEDLRMNEEAHTVEEDLPKQRKRFGLFRRKK